MRARLACSCNLASIELDAATLRELGQILTSALVSFHATHPHCSHEIKIEMDEVPSNKELYIRCLKPHEQCASVRELRTTAVLEMVGALTLMFHTSHEGHPIEITYDGRSWRSPGVPNEE